jgi:hypothetical protein
MLALLLSGCAHQLTAQCAWGAQNEADADKCAAQNFGEQDALWLRETQDFCRLICWGGTEHLGACETGCRK